MASPSDSSLRSASLARLSARLERRSQCNEIPSSAAAQIFVGLDENRGITEMFAEIVPKARHL